MATIASNTDQQQPRFSNSTTEAIWKSSDAILSRGTPPHIDRNARIRARQNRQSMPVAPVNVDFTQPPDSLNKRKNTRPRPTSIRVEGSTPLARTPSVRSAKRQSFGPLLPVIVDGLHTPSPLTSPRNSVQATPPMADLAGDKKLTDDEVCQATAFGPCRV